ncbi:MAG: crosslink repair DNA glycosylase YcaQ family protein [Mycobacteriales bacterium]
MPLVRERLSTAAARRVALAAQGFADPAPTGAPTRRHLRRVLGRTQLLQMDSVNVFERAHHLPAFSRLGPYDTALVDDLAYAKRELFEYWGHEASLLPIALHPLMRWRMDRHRTHRHWQGIASSPIVDRVREELRERGPSGSGALREGEREAGAWWSWDDTKVALEHLFAIGEVTTASRRSFERIYDLTERVLPAAILDLPTPSTDEALRDLVRLSAQALGVATVADLGDYFRIKSTLAAQPVRDLVESGELQPVTVEGWGRPGYLWHEAAIPRKVPASALLSPFDPIVWRRDRALRLYGFDYRIEIYTPAAKRVYGYYTLPFLHDEGVRARVDLKSDRKAGVLRVQSAWLEPGSDPADVGPALLAQLRRAADWQGLADLDIAPRGNLASTLADLTVG